MLIHVTPRIYNPYSNIPAQLIDVSIPELGLVLRNGHELALRRPLPNKRFLVACRMTRQKAINGILIRPSSPITSFTVVTRWEVQEEVVTHHVDYRVLDSDHTFVSDAMLLWYGTGKGLGDFSSRWPASHYQGIPPVHAQPRMDVVDPARWGGERKGVQVQDWAGEDGLIKRREECFYMPTLEIDRLSGSLAQSHRLPLEAHAFDA